MKHLHKFYIGVTALLMLASCADKGMLDYSVKKPESIAKLEYLNDYDVLKSYVDRTADPNFKLGAGVSIDAFNKTGVEYSLIASNFDEMTAGYGMKHGAIVQDDGTLNLAKVDDFVATAKNAGVTIYGHTLCWHANQNAKYLNSTIAPIVIPGTGGPTWDVISSNDFETDDASNYMGNSNAVMSFTANGEGADGTGRALKITNSEVRANDWESQFFFTFSPQVQEGEKYRLTMDVRSDVPASFATQAQTAPYNYLFWDFFGTVSSTTEWSTYTKEITVTSDMAGAGAIAFNLGNTATSYYFDNIKLEKYNENGGGGPTLEPSVIVGGDFENGADGWGGWGNGSTRALSAEGEGYGGTGYAYTFTNPTVADFWSAQVAYDLSPALQNGSTYKLNFKVRSSTAGTIRAEVQSSSDYSSDGFGTFAISPDWKEYTLETTVTKDDRNRFLFDFGDFAGTVYVDDVTLRRVNPDGGGEQIIEKTPQEKRDTLNAALETWISGIMGATKGYVKAWDVVNEPMDDANPYQLKTGVGKELAADQFYWQDYLGKDYAVTAFKLARKYGNPDDKLFINDYNLEYNLDKCKGLIQYVEYIESKGVKVDGIGTQMHIAINSDTAKIAQMFDLLAKTGKLIKISELDIGLGGVKTADATEEQYQAQADMYKYVVQKYFEIIPAQQRYGITVWSPKDSPDDSSWRTGEPIGLWTLSYNRKPAYGAFADGLSGN
ncbi:endo-1,4-beta-xylanase [Prolixibacter denitrificans]|uniref:endo-1,4-beta-xylanase n=2 Tax=Prolixibacter denitrificans TaxID=1541063 RepID=A0A2P8CCQ9_9BACT|nr:endo-1,4-beta-xylanase [Prolixibacter denitrificans]PSK82750.1 carbohydrate binding protein [Prolixibacter denitrificans]